MFDPFASSGVVVVEALKQRRRVIVCDLLPIATEITRLAIEPASETRLLNAFKRFEEKVKPKIERLYKTKCRNCDKDIVFTCAIWQNGEITEIRYQNCPHCGDRRA